MTFCVRLGWEAISSLKIAASLAKPKIKFRLTRQPSTLLTAKSLLKPAWSCTTAWKHQKAPARGALGTLTRCALACRSPCLQRLSNELMAQGLSSGGLPNSDSALISRAFFLRPFKRAYRTVRDSAQGRGVSATEVTGGVLGIVQPQLLGEQIALFVAFLISLVWILSLWLISSSFPTQHQPENVTVRSQEQRWADSNTRGQLGALPRTCYQGSDTL